MAKRNLWKVDFNSNKTIINLIFKVNYKKKTSLKVAINNLIFVRKSLKKKGKLINYIQNYKTNKRKNINNPIGEFYKDFFKNLNRLKYYQTNRNITFDIMKKNYFFLN